LAIFTTCARLANCVLRRRWLCAIAGAAKVHTSHRHVVVPLLRKVAMAA
jgi:hypothetical protein